MARTIFIGDIHGCIAELEELWGLLEVQEEDRVIQVGDLINKGPNSHEVVQFCMKNKMEVILGNHEIRMMKLASAKSYKDCKDYELASFKQLKSSDWDFIGKLPHKIYLKKLGIIVVHAGFLPNKDWRKQSPDVTSRIQVIDKKGNPQKRSKEPDGVPWNHLWMGPQFVIYGHIPKVEIDRNQWTLGLDTSCVYGHKLTAYILESDSFVQVSAKQVYSWNKFVSPLAPNAK